MGLLQEIPCVGMGLSKTVSEIEIITMNVWIEPEDDNNRKIGDPVKVQKKDTVYSLKQKISEILAIEPSKQKLTYYGEVMEDDKTMDFYKVSDGQTIELSERPDYRTVLKGKRI